MEVHQVLDLVVLGELHDLGLPCRKNQSSTCSYHQCAPPNHELQNTCSRTCFPATTWVPYRYLILVNKGF